MWRSIQTFLSRLSALQVLLAAVCLVLIVGAVDYGSGPRAGLSLFYLLPVALAVWFGGAGEGLAVAGLACLVSLASDLLVLEGHFALYPYWNAVIRAGVFLVIVGLLSAMKRSLNNERELLERERETSTRLEELDKLKDTFLRAVSHDVRNPLAAVVGSASILQQRFDDLSADQSKALIDAIVRSGRQITRLIEELLDVERIRGRAFEPEAVTATDLSSLVTGVANEWSATRDRPVTFGDVDRVIARVDPVLMQRIIENLLDNAAKYSPRDGHIWVQVVRGAGGAILAVDDEGPGVPREMRSAIFELFERGKDSGSVPGMGLGLHLVARFSEMLGGRAWVEPRPEGGSSFRVFVPEDDSFRQHDLDPLTEAAARY